MIRLTACAIDNHDTMTVWRAPVVDKCPVCSNAGCRWIRCDYCGTGIVECEL